MNNWMSDALQVSGEADQPRQAADAGSAEEARRVGPLQGRGRRRHRRTARCRATACRRTSRAAPATTPRGSTASGRTTTSRTWTGCRASSRRPARTCRSRWSNRCRAPRSASSRYGTSHWAMTESRDQLREETDVKTSYFRLRAYPFTDDLGDVHRRARARLRHRAEPRRAAAAADALELTPERHRRSCAACCTTAACRSTPAASPTMCWRRKASKWRRRPSRVSAVTAGGDESTAGW